MARIGSLDPARADLLRTQPCLPHPAERVRALSRGEKQRVAIARCRAAQTGASFWRTNPRSKPAANAGGDPAVSGARTRPALPVNTLLESWSHDDAVLAAYGPVLDLNRGIVREGGMNPLMPIKENSATLVHPCAGAGLALSLSLGVRGSAAARRAVICTTGHGSGGRDAFDDLLVGAPETAAALSCSGGSICAHRYRLVPGVPFQSLTQEKVVRAAGLRRPLERRPPLVVTTDMVARRRQTEARGRPGAFAALASVLGARIIPLRLGGVFPHLHGRVSASHRRTPGHVRFLSREAPAEKPGTHAVEPTRLLIPTSDRSGPIRASDAGMGCPRTSL